MSSNTPPPPPPPPRRANSSPLVADASKPLLPAPLANPPPPVSMGRSVGLCAMYGCTSVSITFFNKAVFSVYAFNFPCTVTLLQIIVCLAFLRIAHASKYITLPVITKPLARLVYPLTLCWWTYVVSGLIALRYLNVPMFSTLRKFTALLVLVGERVVLKRNAPTPVWAAITVMVSGGLIAGLTDLTMSVPGYVFVAICCVATAMYLILIVRVGAASGLDTFGLLYYNNVLSLPLMLAYIVLCTTEIAGVAAYPRLAEPQFWAFLLVSASQATVLNIAIFMCTKVNSPLATTVTGQAKDLVTVSVGLFLFGDVKITMPNLFGLCLALVGSMLYSYVKYRASVMARKEHARNKTNDIKV
jgi:solute carrier family 35